MPPSEAHERTITESGRPPGTPLRASRVSGAGRPLRLTAAPPGGRSGRLCPGLAVVAGLVPAPSIAVLARVDAGGGPHSPPPAWFKLGGWCRRGLDVVRVCLVYPGAEVGGGNHKIQVERL